MHTQNIKIFRLFFFTLKSFVYEPYTDCTYTLFVSLLYHTLQYIKYFAAGNKRVLFVSVRPLYILSIYTTTDHDFLAHLWTWESIQVPWYSSIGSYGMLPLAVNADVDIFLLFLMTYVSIALHCTVYEGALYISFF